MKTQKILRHSVRFTIYLNSSHFNCLKCAVGKNSLLLLAGHPGNSLIWDNSPPCQITIGSSFQEQNVELSSQTLGSNVDKPSTIAISN